MEFTKNALVRAIELLRATASEADGMHAHNLQSVIEQSSDVPHCPMLTDEIDLALHG
jgi:hypothetical protein